MEKERTVAIDKFLERRSDGLQLGKLVMDNPGLLTDAGIREAAFREAQTYYKIMLLRANLQYGDVHTAVESIRDRIAQRNGKLEFIDRIGNCWSAMQSIQLQEAPVVLTAETEYLVTTGNT